MSNNIFGIGVKYLSIGKLLTDPSDAEPTYGPKLAMSTLSSVKGSPTTSTAEAYGDDALQASETKVTAFSLDFTIWGLPQATEAEIFGHSVDKDQKQMDDSFSDNAPYLGAGFYKTEKTDTGVQYTAHWYYKSQAVPGDEEVNSAGKDLSLASTNMKMNCVQAAFGKYRAREVFATESDAKAWIDKHFTAAG